MSSIEEYAHRHPQLAHTAEVPSLLERGIRATTGTVVDIGCGEGGTLRSIATSSRRHLVGCDLSLTRSRAARAGEERDLVCANSLDLPFATGVFGLVICRHVIEHVENDRVALLQMSRVLRPDGMAYLETPLRRRGAWYWYRNAEGRRVLDPTHVREYTSVEEFARLVVAGGFEVLAVEVHPIRYPVAHVLYRLLRPGSRARLPNSTLTVRVPRYSEIRMLARTRR